MSDARRYAVWPEPRSRSRSLNGSRPSVPHGTNFFTLFLLASHQITLSCHTGSTRIGRRFHTPIYQGIHENSDNTHLASSNIVLMCEDFYSRAVTKQKTMNGIFPYWKLQFCGADF